jgi:hypothetical protein
MTVELILALGAMFNVECQNRPGKKHALLVAPVVSRPLVLFVRVNTQHPSMFVTWCSTSPRAKRPFIEVSVSSSLSRKRIGPEELRLDLSKPNPEAA